MAIDSILPFSTITIDTDSALTMTKEEIAYHFLVGILNEEELAGVIKFHPEEEKYIREAIACNSLQKIVASGTEEEYIREAATCSSLEKIDALLNFKNDSLKDIYPLFQKTFDTCLIVAQYEIDLARIYEHNK